MYVSVTMANESEMSIMKIVCEKFHTFGWVGVGVMRSKFKGCGQRWS